MKGLTLSNCYTKQILSKNTFVYIKEFLEVASDVKYCYFIFEHLSFIETTHCILCELYLQTHAGIFKYQILVFFIHALKQ